MTTRDSKRTAKLSIKDKTLVAWVSLADPAQCGRHILTIDNAARQFDALAYSEIMPRKWMSASDMHRRTQTDHSGYPDETAGKDDVLLIAVTYRGRKVTIYRNGEAYASYTMPNEPVTFDENSTVLLGQRLWCSLGSLEGAILEARIYNKALTARQVADLEARKTGDVEPVAWWDFSRGRKTDKCGTFKNSTLIGAAEICDGRLVLPAGGGGALLAGSPENPWIRTVGERDANAVSRSMINSMRNTRLKMLNDPHRPAYHFVVPEDFAAPADPNGAIFWNGRYHLGYLYQHEGVHYWGHVSSTDLLHWRHHQPWVQPTPDSPETGIFSGNCFINKQGEATMLYHGCGQGNCISTSSDPLLDKWQKLPSNPIIPNVPGNNDQYAKDGIPYASWDPHGWLDGDTYYGLFGGIRPSIFRAKTLDKWEYVGDLFAHALDGVDIREDVSCADLFKLGDKTVLVCISHRLGCRYYVGEWKNEQFHPEFHEKMSWVDNEYFAPETLLDDKGRRILWTWVFDGRMGLTRVLSGWSGTFGLPRVLTLAPDNSLRMDPVEELARLRHNPRVLSNVRVADGAEVLLPGIEGNCTELALEILTYHKGRCGVKVCCAPDGSEETLIYYDAEQKQLCVDTTKSGLVEGKKLLESGPFELAVNEPLRLRVFIDKSIVEVFANSRQVVTRRIYPSRKDSVGVKLLSCGGASLARSVKAWDMMPSNPY